MRTDMPDSPSPEDAALPEPEGLFDRLIQFAIQNAIWVMLFVAAWIGIGIYSYQKLPIDAVPDITNTQVQINTQANGFTALEIEQRITYPIENAMSGMPKLEQTRSISRYGLSQITVVFKDGTDIYWARQLINQRLQEAQGEMPDGVQPVMSPVSTGLGEIYQWVIKAGPDARKPDGTPYTAMDLREIQDWIVRPQLQRVEGVAEVNSIGGFNKTYVVAPDLNRLQQLQIPLSDLQAALTENNENRGAGYIEKNGQQLTVRVPGTLDTLEDIQNISIANKSGYPIRVADVASVSIGHDLRTGAATYNGEETVLGIAMMMMGENSRTVAQAIDAKVQAIQQSLPKGVVIETVYDRTHLVNRAIATVQKNLVEGAILVIVILFVFLGNFRAALITACVIPLSMLFTLTGMAEQKISANLMSLGALDFGIIVDGAVVIVENCVRRLAHAQQRRYHPAHRQQHEQHHHQNAEQVDAQQHIGQHLIGRRQGTQCRQGGQLLHANAIHPILDAEQPHPEQRETHQAQSLTIGLHHHQQAMALALPLDLGRQDLLDMQRRIANRRWQRNHHLRRHIGFGPGDFGGGCAGTPRQPQHQHTDP